MTTSRRSTVLLVLVTLWCALNPATSFAQDSASVESPRVRVKATGQAPADLINAREAAVEDALRRCVEAGGGVQLASISESQDFSLASDVIYTKTAGFIESYEVLQENPNQDGLFTVRVSAVVSRGDINANVEAFKAMLKRKGRPRALVVGSVDGQPLDARLTAQLQKMLEHKGIRVIDTAAASEQQRRDAELAARLDEDLKKAALITQQLMADVLVVVTVEGETLPPEDHYGGRSFPIDAVGTVKLIRADTAEVLGVEVIEERVSDDTPEKALRTASSRVSQEALRSTIRRIALHWLEEVDQRGGQEVVVVLHKFTFKRIAALVENLRKVGGVRDVIVDRTNPDALSQLRVVTNSSAADVGIVLTHLDPDLTISGSSANRLEAR